MGKIIKLSQREDYFKALTQTIQELDNFENELMNAIVDLATLGKWKEWSDEQPIGTTFEFTDEMLWNTGDANIDCLNALVAQIKDAKKAIERNPKL